MTCTSIAAYCYYLELWGLSFGLEPGFLVMQFGYL